MLRIYTTADAFSLSDVWRNTIKSRFRTVPSNVVTVDGPLLLLHRSIDRSIDRTLRRKFQRRSTPNVGELTRFFPPVKTSISAPPLPPPFPIHCSFCATNVRSNMYFFFFLSSSTRPRNGPSPCADLTECQNDAVHRRLLHYTVINVCDCMFSCIPLRLPHAVHLPDVLQLGVAQC
jgi:hypothetical protein